MKPDSTFVLFFKWLYAYLIGNRKSRRFWAAFIVLLVACPLFCLMFAAFMYLFVTFPLICCVAVLLICIGGISWVWATQP